MVWDQTYFCIPITKVNGDIVVKTTHLGSQFTKQSPAKVRKKEKRWEISNGDDTKWLHSVNYLKYLIFLLNFLVVVYSRDLSLMLESSFALPCSGTPGTYLKISSICLMSTGTLPLLWLKPSWLILNHCSGCLVDPPHTCLAWKILVTLSPLLLIILYTSIRVDRTWNACLLACFSHWDSKLL